MNDPRYTYRMGVLIGLLVASIIFVGTFATCAHADDVTYTTTTDLNGNLTTTGSDGSKAVSAKCQTCARPSYETTYSDGSKARTTQAATNDSWTTEVRK